MMTKRWRRSMRTETLQRNAVTRCDGHNHPIYGESYSMTQNQLLSPATREEVDSAMTPERLTHAPNANVVLC